MNGDLGALQARIGYTFRDPAHLERALTHPSWLQGKSAGFASNQRLEFLGDSVLQLILTEALFGLFPADREGELTTRRAVLSKGAFLSRLAREIGLEACLRMGANEDAAGGRNRDAALEDAFEALVGAISLDGGLESTRKAVLGIYGSLPSRLEELETLANPKGRLQEIVQPAHGNQALRYEVLATEGADHERRYEVAVYLLERRLGSGKGPSKRIAEEEAARAALAAVAQAPARP
jgi:ribonuclease III